MAYVLENFPYERQGHIYIINIMDADDQATQAITLSGTFRTGYDFSPSVINFNRKQPYMNPNRIANQICHNDCVINQFSAVN